MEDQHAEMCITFRVEIGRVKAHLDAGKHPSEIANALHAEGVGDIQLIFIFREATGASVRDLKAFGQWWDGRGVTDVEAFDAWAARVLAPQAKTS